jgi:hypothetical protein
MGEYSEAFVAFDVAKQKHAVAVAEGGRRGEVRGTIRIFVCEAYSVSPTIGRATVSSG